MSGSVNKVILVGNVGADPEVRSTQDGRMVVNLRLATSETWRDKQSGERREKTEWHRVVIFHDGLARVADQYIRKGSKIYLEGQLQTREWQDKDGAKRYTTEIVLQGFNAAMTLLDSPRTDEQRPARRQEEPRDEPRSETRGEVRGGGMRRIGQGAPPPARDDAFDDEIPF